MPPPASLASRLRTRAWPLFVVVAVVLLAVHVLLPVGSLEQSLVYSGVGIFAIAAIIVGVAIHRPETAWPWLLLAAGQASFVVGDLLWVWFEFHGETPFPSIADAFYLAGYPFAALAFGLLIRRRIGGGDRSGLLDAAILTTGGSVLTWVLLVEPVLAGSDATILELAISLAYPLADVVIIGVAAGLLTTPGSRTASFRLLVASLLVLLAADEIYAVQTVLDAYVSGSLLDITWLISYLAIGAAALHPSMREVVRAQPVNVTWLGPVRLVFLAGAMLTGPLLMVLSGQVPGAGMLVVALGTAVLSVLVLARLAGLVAHLARDVSARRVLEEQLSHQANHDPLTGLPNRRMFVDRITGAVADTSRHLAVLFIDLDDFKTVNDTLGHATGDDLLVALAGRIRAAIRPSDLAARLGGDEFGILLDGGRDETLPERMAERILERINEPLSIGGLSLTVRASIGIATRAAGLGRLENPSDDVADLLRNADLAMYQAKADGKNGSCVFAETMHSAVAERLQLRSDLVHALERDEFVVHYQPIVELSSGSLRGIEALVRWQHPTRGLIPPAAFIPLAEESGLIVGLGRRILAEACREAVRLTARFGDAAPQTVAVNVSPRQLGDASFGGDVEAILAASGLPAERLIVEITETVLAAESSTTVTNLGRLRARGVRVAIDDFGTGYASLSYLQRFPIDIIKIDRSFVAALTEAAGTGALARLVVSVGGALDLETIAEGVEVEAQLDELRRLGCRLGQGFLFARPLASADLDDLIAGTESTRDVRARRALVPGRHVLGLEPT